MSDSDTVNAAVMSEDPAKVRVDVQDPLPETNWFWRRVYTFALSLISVALIWYGFESLNAMRNADHVYRLARYMIGVHVMLITYYMLAPSAEQMVKLIQLARLLRSGVPITRSAVVEMPQGGRTEVTTTAGAPDNPPTQGGGGQRPEDDVAPRSRT